MTWRNMEHVITLLPRKRSCSHRQRSDYLKEVDSQTTSVWCEWIFSWTEFKINLIIELRKFLIECLVLLGSTSTPKVDWNHTGQKNTFLGRNLVWKKNLTREIPACLLRTLAGCSSSYWPVLPWRWLRSLERCTSTTFTDGLERIKEKAWTGPK